MCAKKDKDEVKKFQDTWTRDEAESWLSDNDFEYSGTVGGIEIPEVMTNWYAYRQENPDKYDDFRNDMSPFGFDEGDGVMAVYGIKDNGERTTEVQSIRFYHGDEEEQDNQVQCPNCDEWIDDDVDECPDCGHTLSDKYLYRCPSCEVFISNPKIGSCSSCGKDVDPFEVINPIRMESSYECKLKIGKHWAGGELAKGNPKNVHYDIFFKDKQFVSTKNPLDEETVCSNRKPYKKSFIDDIDKTYNFFDKGKIGSLNDEGSWLKVIFEQDAKVYEMDDCYAINISEEDKMLCLKEKDADVNKWSIDTIDFEECCEFNNSEIIELGRTEETLHLSMKSKSIKLKNINFEDDIATIEGLIISEGSWNGVWFSKDLLEEVPEDIINDIRLDVGPTHDDKIEDAGRILSSKWRDEEKGWWINAVVEDEEAIERLKEMEEPGFSIETNLYIDRRRNIVEEVNDISCVVVVSDPACRVCFLE